MAKQFHKSLFFNIHFFVKFKFIICCKRMKAIQIIKIAVVIVSTFFFFFFFFFFTACECQLFFSSFWMVKRIISFSQFELFFEINVGNISFSVIYKKLRAIVRLSFQMFSNLQSLMDNLFLASWNFLLII